MRPALASGPSSAGESRTVALLAVSAALVVAGLVHLVVFLVDGRSWAGPVSWRKPFTFGVAFGVTLAAVTWVSSYLQVPARTRSILLWVFAADCVVEVGGITLQAWRGVPSHLNRSTPFNTAVAMALAVGGGVLIVVLGRFAVPALRGRTDAAPSMRLALHAVLVLPALAWLAARQPWPEARRLRVVRIGAAAYGVAALAALAFDVTTRAW